MTAARAFAKGGVMRRNESLPRLPIINQRGGSLW